MDYTFMAINQVYCCLLITFANNLDQNQANKTSGSIRIQNVRHSEGFPERIFRKRLFRKKNQKTTKKHEKLTRGQELTTPIAFRTDKIQ